MDLLLGLRMHISPQFLQLCGSLSSPVVPTRSILQGCSLSIPFTRALHRTRVQRIADLSSARLTVYVDDIGQHTTGTRAQVFRQLRDAAIDLANMASGLRLTISKKTTLVASCPRMASRLRDVLRRQGIRCQTAPVARDPRSQC